MISGSCPELDLQKCIGECEFVPCSLFEAILMAMDKYKIHECQCR